MRARLGQDVIDRSADEGMRLVALALLGDADDAAARMAEGSDPESLHDFRVALRRLRTALRSYRPWLGQDTGRGVERKLKRCARATNAARDAEVQLAWLASKREALTERQKVGSDALARRIEDTAHEVAVPRVLERYRRASSKLARRLGRHERRIEAAAQPGGRRFGGALAALVSDEREALSRRVAAIQGPVDEEEIHRARIQAKRLRYLLEPLRGNRHADAQDAVQRLKRLQDVLGELHDVHVLAGEVRRAMIAAARDHARDVHRAVYEAGIRGAPSRDAVRERPRAGLVAITRLLRERRDALFAELEREWRAGGLDALAAEVRAIVGALE